MSSFRIYVVRCLIRGLSLCMTCALFFSFSSVFMLWRYLFVPFSFVSTLYPIISPYVSNLYLILSHPFSMLESMSSWFDTTLTAFPTHSLVEVDPNLRVSMCYQPIITSLNFVNRAPCRALGGKSAGIWSVLQYTNGNCVAFKPLLNKEVTYINVPGVPSSWLLPDFPIFIALWLSWKKGSS